MSICSVSVFFLVITSHSVLALANSNHLEELLDERMGGKVNGWISTFILGSNEATCILHWKSLGSNIHLLSPIACQTPARHWDQRWMDILVLRDLTQISKKTRTFSWRYTCGAPCLTGGAGEMGVQEKGRKGSATWCILKRLPVAEKTFQVGWVGWWHGDAKVKGQQDSLLLGQEHREQWQRRDWKVRQEPKVDLPHLHMSALSGRKSDELIRQVLKVSKALWLGTVKWLNELLPRNLVWHKSIFFFFSRFALFPSGGIRFRVLLWLRTARRLSSEHVRQPKRPFVHGKCADPRFKRALWRQYCASTPRTCSAGLCLCFQEGKTYRHWRRRGECSADL